MAAELSNVLPFPGGLTLEQLTLAWIDAKRDEDAANARRIALEQQICALQPPKEEGATTIDVAGVKLTITGSLKYSCEDLDAVREITRAWDAELVPIQSKATLSPTGCKWLRRERPDLWAQLARAVSVTPAKASLKVSV